MKRGAVLDRFCNKCPLSRSRTSMWKVWSRPPPKPTAQVTERPCVVWLCTSQFWGGSGGPNKIIAIQSLYEYVQCSKSTRQNCLPRKLIFTSQKKLGIFTCRKMLKKITCWNKRVDARFDSFPQYICCPTVNDAKVLFRFCSVIELGKGAIALVLIDGNLISFVAVVESPAKTRGKGKSSHPANHLKNRI